MPCILSSFYMLYDFMSENVHSSHNYKYLEIPIFDSIYYFEKARRCLHIFLYIVIKSLLVDQLYKKFVSNSSINDIHKC